MLNLKKGDWKLMTKLSFQTFPNTVIGGPHSCEDTEVVHKRTQLLSVRILFYMLFSSFSRISDSYAMKYDHMHAIASSTFSKRLPNHDTVKFSCSPPLG